MKARTNLCVAFVSVVTAMTACRVPTSGVETAKMSPSFSVTANGESSVAYAALFRGCDILELA